MALTYPILPSLGVMIILIVGTRKRWTGLCTLRMLVMNTGASYISGWQGILAASNPPVNFAEMI